MKILLCRLLVVVACAVCAAVVVVPASALASETLSIPGAGPLIEPVGAGQAEEAALARLSSQEALAEDAASRMEFAGYGRDAAVALAQRVFGLGSSSGEAVLGQGGASITSWIGQRGAVETLPDGKHVLVESSVPLRSSVGSGHLAPVSLALTAGESGYAPANPLVAVVLSKSAAEGVTFPYGLQVTPVQHGAPESSEVVGDSIFYPGTAKDTDFMLEPALDGAEASWQVLSAEGSAENALSFTLPAGASLVLSHSIEGAAEVLLEGQRLMLVMPATATEANGASLPVSYSVNGDTLTSHVDLSGNVDFPVMVDPLITQEYGGSSGFWAGWGESGTEGAYFEGGPGNTGILAGLNENYGNGKWAAREVYAPGWATKEGSITRVVVQGLLHLYGPDTHLEAGLVGGEALSPIWTYKPAKSGEINEGQLNTGEEFKGRSATFCAKWGGGYDGGPQPLCDETFGNNYFHLSIYATESKSYKRMVMIENTWVKYIDTSQLTSSFNTGATTAGGHTNVLGPGEAWLGAESGTRLEYSAADKAFGVSKMVFQWLNGNTWETVASNNFSAEGDCLGVVCPVEPHIELGYTNLTSHPPDGEHEVRVIATDPSGIEVSVPEKKLRFDNTPPHALTVTGADVKGSTVNITEGAVGNWVTFSATDGETGTPSSGIKALAIEVDEHQQGGSQGACSPGPCTAKGTWVLNGRELGAGVHTLTVIATDNAGNVASAEYTLIVHAAAPVAMGPGSVNPESGDFAIESTDVSLADGAGALAVTRHYDSRNVNEGVEGPLGPQWSIGLGSMASLEVLESEGKVQGVMVVGSDGLSFFSVKANGGFEPPPGDSSLSLTLVNDGVEYVLEDKKKGVSTTFTHPEGAKEWLPTIAKGTVATDTVTDAYKSVEVGQGKRVVEPTEELAPHGSEKCPPNRAEMQQGCRALLFYYGNENTTQPEAKGESQSEWGWYANRLTKVVAAAWSVSAKEMQEVAVAEYSYDKKGRLRAEWDPRISPALKTIYGYDSEGHVTAVSPPGQQPWLMTYGTTPEDGSAGRLVKVFRPKASTALWAGLLPEKTEAPTISGTAAQGIRLAVSKGKWSHSALAYGYQWEDCNTQGQQCSVIPGAINGNYTPVAGDVGHKLIAVITASNAGGSTTASSAATAEVTSTQPLEYAHHTETADAGNAIDAISCLSSSDCVLGDSKGNALYATNVTATGAASWSSWTGPGKSPADAIDCPTTGLCLLAAGGEREGKGNLYYASSFGGAWSEAYSPGYGVDAISCASASFCIDGQNGYGYFRYSTNPPSTSWTLEYQGTAAMNGVFCLSSSFCALADSKGSVHIATSTSQIESSSWIETDVDGSSALNGITCVSTSWCLAIDGSGNLLTLSINSSGTVTSTKKLDIDGSNPLTSIRCTSNSWCVTVDSHGNVFVSSNAGSNWSKAWELGGDLTSVSCISEKLCLTAGTSGQVVAFNPTEKTKNEGTVQAAQAGNTIEYDMPVAGSGAPYAMGTKEVEEWGQKDLPMEAFAVFPEEQPQKWPASGHTGATFTYIDDEAHTVNTIAPSGGIATIEYENGEVVRSLSADNRATALKETNHVQAAEKLSTLSKYRAEGGELAEVTGPEHKVKLANGEEANARNNVRYFYDEGAPLNEKGETEVYGLVTKTVDGALLANKEEKDLRTTLTGYSGQEGLGWTLRSPTSVTTEPQGADLVSVTVYNKETGAVEETRAPGGTSEAVYPPSFSSSFGSEGSGNGQFNAPMAVSVDTQGNRWVADTGNNRIEKFSSVGSFIGAYGSSGSGNGQFSKPSGVAIAKDSGQEVYVADAGNNRVQEFTTSGEYIRQWGSKGSGEGQFEEPRAIAVDPAGNVWVSDYLNNRVQEFTSTGQFIRKFGGWGSGNGQFKEPGQIAFSGGMVYVVDQGDKRVEEFSPTGTFVTQFGSAGTGKGQWEGPWGIVTAPVTGDLYVSDAYQGKVLQFSPNGKFLTEFGHLEGLEAPEGLAVDAQGNVYVPDQKKNQVTAWQPAGAGGAIMHYLRQWGSEGWHEGQFYTPVQPAVDASGNVWVSDYGNNRLQKFSKTGQRVGELAGVGKGPTGVAINQSTGNIYVADREDDKIQQYTSSGEFVRSFGEPGTERGKLTHPGELAIDTAGNVWVADTGNNRIQEFSATGTPIAAYGTKGSGNEQFVEPAGIAFSGGNVYVADAGNHRVLELTSSEGKYVRQWGTYGTGSGQFYTPQGIAADPAGNLYVTDSGASRVQEFSATGRFLASFASTGTWEGQLKYPEGIAINSAGDAYIADGGNDRVQEWMPERQAVHDTKTIYYSPHSEAGVLACENHAEWAKLPCRTEPAAQPTDSAVEPKGEELPDLPVITTEYNMWYQPVKVTETIGNTTRSKTTSYEGERPTSQSLTGGAGEAVPAVSFKYSSTLGMLIEQSTENSKAEVKKLTRVLNTLGQLESYTDASGNATTYSYDQYGRPIEVDFDSSKLDHMEAKQTLHYEETTGRLTELSDLGGEGTYNGKGAGTFKATYDLEENIVSETYPDAMTATYTYNSINEAVSLVDQKTNNCAGAECEWFKDSLTPSIHGETLSQSSSLASVQYHYEPTGRLSEVQETPTGEGCTTRIYAYNEEADRTSLTTRQPGVEGKCATEGGTVEHHIYDEANRLTDEGTQYEPVGNIAKLPAADAGGHQLETEYYNDGQVHSQTQAEKTNIYTLDPENRTLATETLGKNLTSTTIISHYAAPGGSVPAWTENPSTGSWTRNIASFGGLVAIEESGKQAIIQLRDLQGNIIGTASPNESNSKPISTERTTEFGVPVSEKPADKYGWLGTIGVSAEQSSGVIVQDGATYVPQLGAALQTVRIPEPPVINAVTPAVIAVPPFVPVNSVEADGKAGAGGTPGGNVPEPEGEEEDECTGMKACSASVNHHHHPGVVEYKEGGNGYAGCSVWTSYGTEYGTSGISGEIEIYGHWKCQEAVPMFEMQIQLVVWDPETSKWYGVDKPYIQKYFDVNGDGGEKNNEDFTCPVEHAWYAAWIFGEQFDGSYKGRWWSSGRERKLKMGCHGGVGLPDTP